MKSLFICLIIINSLLAFDYKLKPKKVSTETHCFFGLPEVMDKHNNGNMSNSCFVDMGTHYLVIDSGPTYLFAQQAYSQMKKIKNLPIAYVINTHTHDDHWLGNSYYKSIGVKIIGSYGFKDEIKVELTRMQRKISPKAYVETTQVFPDILVKDKNTLIINANKVELISVNQKAHTKSDLLVYIPSQKTIFVGDLVFNERLPSIRDGDIIGWLKALDSIKKMDVKYVVGGHGDLVGKNSLDFTYNYLSKIKSSVSLLIEEGEDIADVVDALKMKEYKNINFYDSIHRQNVETAYRMLEWNSE